MGKSGEIRQRCYAGFCTPLLGVLSAAVLLSRIEHGWGGQTLNLVTCLGDKLQSDLNVLAQGIVEDLEATLEQFREITTDLGR